MDLIQLIHEYCKMHYPYDIPGQLRFFSTELPTARQKLIDAIHYEFGQDEINTLAEILNDLRTDVEVEKDIYD